MDYSLKLSKEFNIRPDHSANIITLIDDGNTIPFIARYRKEATGSCDDQVLREFNDRLKLPLSGFQTARPQALR